MVFSRQGLGTDIYGDFLQTRYFLNKHQVKCVLKATLQMSITKKKVEGLRQWDMWRRPRAGEALVGSSFSVACPQPLLPPGSLDLRKEGTFLVLGILHMLQIQASTRNQEVPNSTARQHPRNIQGTVRQSDHCLLASREKCLLLRLNLWLSWED